MARFGRDRTIRHLFGIRCSVAVSQTRWPSVFLSLGNYCVSCVLVVYVYRLPLDEKVLSADVLASSPRIHHVFTCLLFSLAGKILIANTLTSFGQSMASVLCIVYVYVCTCFSSVLDRRRIVEGFVTHVSCTGLAQDASLASIVLALDISVYKAHLAPVL